jgi:hypothetical protein
MSLRMLTDDVLPSFVVSCFDTVVSSAWERLLGCHFTHHAGGHDQWAEQMTNSSLFDIYLLSYRLTNGRAFMPPHQFFSDSKSRLLIQHYVLLHWTHLPPFIQHAQFNCSLIYHIQVQWFPPPTAALGPKAGTLFLSFTPGTSRLGLAVKKLFGLSVSRMWSTGIL